MNVTEIAKACNEINETTKELALLTVKLEKETGENYGSTVIENLDNKLIQARHETKI